MPLSAQLMDEAIFHERMARLETRPHLIQDHLRRRDDAWNDAVEAANKGE